MEEGNEIDRFKRIEDSLSAIEKKMSEKWVLPVSLVVLGAIITAANFLFQRQMQNADVFKNERSKSIAEYQARSEAEFYQRCFNKIDTLAVTFESYCEFGPSEEDNRVLSSTLVSFHTMIYQQFPLDPKVKSALLRYNNWLSENINRMNSVKAEQKLGKEDLERAFKVSKEIQDSAISIMNAAFYATAK